MSINKNIKYLLIVFIMLVIIPFNVKAILTKETAPVVNSFTIKQLETYTVTYNNGNYTYTGALTAE